MADTERRPLVRACGASIQFGTALFLIAGLAGFVVRAATGEWPALLSHELSPAGSAAGVALVTFFGVSGLVLGQRIKKGNLCAAKWFTAASVPLLLLALFHIVVTGRGWYEMLLLAFLTLDGAAAMSCAQRVPSSSTDTTA